MNRILLLEDDIGLIDGLCYSLQKNGFILDTAQTVAEAYAHLQQNSYDLLLLDITLPDGNGFDVCNWVRGQGNDIPIIFLTALDEEVNIIRGLDNGGDDYITKPFKLVELCSRIRALLRRAGVSHTQKTTTIERGDIIIDILRSRVLQKGQVLDLTNVEYRLLCMLVRNANHIVTRDMILSEL